MAYSARADIFKRLQGTGSAIAVDELVVGDILRLTHSLIKLSPSMTAKEAVSAVFADG